MHLFATCKDDLICDMAETYGIYDMRSMPAMTVAVLACGLRENARIRNHDSVNIDTLLSARTVDLLSLLVWMRTKDGAHNRNRPLSLVDILLGKDKKSNGKEKIDVKSYKTAEAFELAWKAGGGG